MPTYAPHIASKGQERSKSLGFGSLKTLTSNLTPASTRLLSGNYSESGALIINFPAMPDSIDLVRKANYTVTPSFVMPDGFHMYRNTDPLSIPFSFKLHAFDEEFCPQGGLSLLDLAAKLHALTLPIYNGANQLSVMQAGPAATPSNGAENQVTVIGNGIETGTAFPVAAVLDLIYTGSESPGICCVGYVESVNVKLNGPWLSAKGGGVRNLPTSLDGSFVFVHRPSHSNTFGALDSASNSNLTNRGIRQAYADDIKNRLYNTINLAVSNGEALQSYQGFREGSRNG